MEETENIPVKTEEEAGEPTEASPVATSVAKDSGEISDTETQPVFPQATVAMLQSVPNQTENILILDQNGQALQCERMVIVTGHTENGQVYVIPSNHQGAAQVLLPHGQLLDIPHMTDACVDKSSHNALQTVTLATLSNDANSLALATPQNVTPTKTVPKSPSDDFVSPLKPASSKTPDWALRLRCYEKIGDSYRGYCNTEAELEAVLLLHKQQTHSIFGTRQSPSPAKPATRLMWKSQYVPYDGIPFVNAGSRAIVMECQFGPRRKGQQPKKGAEQETNQNADYKATCPARIYIKKVRKFPEYRVPTDPKVDKKVVRQEQEKAFFNLKKGLWDAGGVIRYYVQLPTRKAHLYHDMDKLLLLPYPEQPLPEEREMTEEEPEEGGSEGEGAEEDESCVPSRLHPHVAEKIRELVAQGHKQVYSVRKQLRKFVEREMFKSVMVPEKHNLCYFPTFNDIKNHIHEAQKALQLAAPGPDATHTQWEAETGDSLTESVKAAVLEASDSLSPEAVQLFSSLTPLQPKTSQLQTVEVQLTPSPTEGDPPQQPVPAELFPVPVAPQPLLLSPTRFLQPSGSLGFTVTLAEPPLTGLSPTAEAEHGATVTQIILQDGRALPVQIVDPASIALPAPVDEAPLDEESLTSPAHSPAD